jgi:hypothetical protein
MHYSFRVYYIHTFFHLTAFPHQGRLTGIPTFSRNGVRFVWRAFLAHRSTIWRYFIFPGYGPSLAWRLLYFSEKGLK